MYAKSLLNGLMLAAMASSSIYCTTNNAASKAKQFRELLRKRVHARLQDDSATYDATQAEFAARSAEARAAAKELYALCPYYIVGLFSGTAKKRSICSLLADVANNPTHFEHIENAIYYEAKKAVTSSEAKNNEIIANKLKAYKLRTRPHRSRTKDGLKRELDPSCLAKYVTQD